MKKLLLWLLVPILIVYSVGCDELSGVSVQTVEPSVEQVKADLLGHTLTSRGVQIWEFAALSEYEEFDINNKLILADALEYDVSMKLIDFPTGNHFRADILIVYKKDGSKWELVSLVTKVFEQISEGDSH
ncbi:hypothetical protein ACFLWR_04790 [Chloroflexota bacterium]